jgi:hypothetical protein
LRQMRNGQVVRNKLNVSKPVGELSFNAAKGLEEFHGWIMTVSQCKETQVR